MTDTPLLRMEGIDKSFPGVHALRAVDLDLARGEVLALAGENGAGKSTLLKILGGVIRPGRGTIRIDGAPASFRNPLDARRAGVAVIHQELHLVPDLSVRENLFLGHERSAGGFVRFGEETRRARELLGRLGSDLDPEAPCGSLPVGQQQLVEIAKALSVEARILVMDEPTSALSPSEAGRLLALVRELRTQGLGIIYVSHRLEELFAIADRILVQRDGARVDLRPTAAWTRPALIEAMVGRALESEFPRRQVALGPERLVVRGLRRGKRVRDVSFSVRAGEIVALAGLVGAGRTETLRLLFGADRADGGTIELDGRALRIRSPRDAIRAGIALLPEDRKSQGLVLGASVRENFGLPNVGVWSRAGFVDGATEARELARGVDDLGIRLASPESPVATLSGGNQQKVVLAKWLARRCQVLLFDEPTRGIDVGAKAEIYGIMNALAGEGKAVLMASSDLPEVLGMADRILVLHEGRVTGEVRDVARATQEEILRLAVGA